jgi:hypothetical protein
VEELTLFGLATAAAGAAAGALLPSFQRFKDLFRCSISAAVRPIYQQQKKADSKTKKKLCEI